MGDLPYIDSHTICKHLIYLFVEMYGNHGLKSSLRNIWYVNNVTFQFTCWWKCQYNEPELSIGLHKFPGRQSSNDLHVSVSDMCPPVLSSLHS